MSVGLWVGDRGIIKLDALLFAEVLEFLSGKVCSVIGDDAMWDTETEDDGSDEIDSSRGCYVCDRHGLYLFCKLVDGHQEVGVSTAGRFPQWSYHIKSPLGEWPGKGNRL